MIKIFFLILILMNVFFSGCLKKTINPANDYKHAIYWSLRAAEGGSVSAQKQLGSMYYLGNGVKKDLKKAYMWYKLASISNDASAKTFLDIITALLPGDQVSDAQTLFTAMQKKIMHSK
ncbi:MAG: sel1 repeat family protein [Deltaproteobacteria bacterium]|nr:sel1 repeat family protein [Deltaproteobacteria bacterium]